MNGSRYDKIRRIWIERVPTWRRVPLPATSEKALLSRGMLRSEIAIDPPKDKNA